jgi:hypothetical protein
MRKAGSGSPGPLRLIRLRHDLGRAADRSVSESGRMQSRLGGLGVGVVEMNLAAHECREHETKGPHRWRLNAGQMEV